MTVQILVSFPSKECDDNEAITIIAEALALYRQKLLGEKGYPALIPDEKNRNRYLFANTTVMWSLSKQEIKP